MGCTWATGPRTRTSSSNATRTTTTNTTEHEPVSLTTTGVVSPTAAGPGSLEAGASSLLQQQGAATGNRSTMSSTSTARAGFFSTAAPAPLRRQMLRPASSSSSLNTPTNKAKNKAKGRKRGQGASGITGEPFVAGLTPNDVAGISSSYKPAMLQTELSALWRDLVRTDRELRRGAESGGEPGALSSPLPPQPTPTAGSTATRRVSTLRGMFKLKSTSQSDNNADQPLRVTSQLSQFSQFDDADHPGGQSPAVVSNSPDFATGGAPSPAPTWQGAPRAHHIRQESGGALSRFARGSSLHLLFDALTPSSSTNAPPALLVR